MSSRPADEDVSAAGDVRPLRVGLLGFGEVALCFAGALCRVADVSAYDHGITDGSLRAAEKLRSAEQLGVRLESSPRGFGDRDVVLSLVTPANALAVAEDFAPEAQAGQRYVDLNSAAPRIKAAVAGVLAPRGVSVVDGVLTGGGVRLDEHRVPIMLAGPDSVAAAAQLCELGLNASALSERLGAAAAVKMLRSAAIKGFEALCVETLLAAQRYELLDEVLATLVDTFDRIPARDLIEHLVQSHADHSARRSVEVLMVCDTLVDRDVRPVMSGAALEVFQRSARGGRPRVWDGSRSLHEVLEHLARGMDEDERLRGAEVGGGGTPGPRRSSST